MASAKRTGLVAVAVTIGFGGGWIAKDTLGTSDNRQAAEDRDRPTVRDELEELCDPGGWGEAAQLPAICGR